MIDKNKYLSIGIVAGFIVGMIIGVILWIFLKNIFYIAYCSGFGMLTGIVIGVIIDYQNKE